MNNIVTPAQQSALQSLKARLTCVLCNQPYGSCTDHEPVYLMTCMHTFGRSCINTHMENDWCCPLSHCRKSVTNIGSGTTAIRTNPIYSNMSKSLHEIERIMASARDYNNDAIMSNATDGSEQIVVQPSLGNGQMVGFTGIGAMTPSGTSQMVTPTDSSRMVGFTGTGAMTPTIHNNCLLGNATGDSTPFLEPPPIKKTKMVGSTLPILDTSTTMEDGEGETTNETVKVRAQIR